MHTICRHVLVELLKVFLVCLTVLTLFMLLVGVIREASNQGLGPAQIIRLLPYVLPDALRFSLPGTLLFAACNVYGRMAASNEIVAVKALGISPLVLLRPALALSLAMSFVGVWLNDVAVSWGTEGVRCVVVEEAAEIAYGVLRTQRTYGTRRFSVTVKDVIGRRLIKPVFSFQASDGTPPMTIQADEAELRTDAEADALVITFRNGTMDAPGRMSAQLPDTFEQAIPLEGASQTARVSQVPALLPLRIIPERIAEERANIERFDQEFAVIGGYQMLTGEFEALTGIEWDTRMRLRQNSLKNLHRLETEPMRRWANGFSCLCFVIVGAPMAIRLRNCDVLTTFFICFLPILMLYYPLLTYGVDAAKGGHLPPACVWLGNVVLGCWGLWLTWKVRRY